MNSLMVTTWVNEWIVLPGLGSIGAAPYIATGRPHAQFQSMASEQNKKFTFENYLVSWDVFPHLLLHS